MECENKAILSLTILHAYLSESGKKVNLDCSKEQQSHSIIQDIMLEIHSPLDEKNTNKKYILKKIYIYIFYYND